MTTATPRPIRHADDRVTFVPIALLQESPTNPRRFVNRKQLVELAESIRSHGVVQPLLVRPLHGSDHLEVVAGARRLRAAREAALLEVPCFVRELDDKQVLEIQFVENLQRSDLHPLDEGQGYRALHEDHGYSVEDLAGKLGKSASYVYGRMQLAKLPAKAQALFLEGAIDLSHAQLLCRIAVPEFAAKAAATIAKGFGAEKPIPYRQAVDFVRREYQCDLRNAPFDTGDADLVPEAGACGRCPKRSSNQRGLFGDADEKNAPDLCTDSKCFAAKTRAFFRQQKAEVLEKGGEVFEGKAAQVQRHSAEFVRPDQINTSDPKMRTWQQLTKGQQVKPVLMQGPHGEVTMRWRRADALRAAKANGHGPKKREAGPLGASDKVRADWAEQQRIREIVNRRALPAIAEVGESLDARAAWRLMLLDLAGNAMDVDLVAERRGLDFSLTLRNRLPRWRSKDTETAIEAMTVAQLQGLAIEMLGAGGPDAMCTELGVDVKSLTVAVKAEEKAKAKEAANGGANKKQRAEQPAKRARK